MPSFMNRFCQRQTQIFDLPVPAHDLVGANTVGAREDDRRPPSVFLRGVTVPGDRFKSAADGPRDHDGNSGAHAPDSHGNRNRGVPIRTLAADPGNGPLGASAWPSCGRKALVHLPCYARKQHPSGAISSL